MKTALDNFFDLTGLKTNVKREILAGFTTFISMAYILFVNPEILGASGMDKGAVFTATALASAIGYLAKSPINKQPIALARAFSQVSDRYRPKSWDQCLLCLFSLYRDEHSMANHFSWCIRGFGDLFTYHCF